MTPALSRTLNALGLIAICAVLLAAYGFQFARGELPCPLCLLQRIGMAAVGYGLALNVVYGPRPSHYGVTLLAALFGAVVSITQILLHIVPGTGSYGSPFLGLHYYTWAVITFFFVMVGTAGMLLFDRQFPAEEQPAFATALGRGAMILLVVVTAGNVISTFLQCGIYQCAASAVEYRLLQ